MKDVCSRIRSTFYKIIIEKTKCNVPVCSLIIAKAHTFDCLFNSNGNFS